MAAPGPKGESAEASQLGAYQQQIAELEGTVTHLRQRLLELNVSTSELLDSRNYLSDLFQNAPVGYIIHDSEGIISQINHTGARLLDFVRAGSRPVSLTQFIPKDQLQTWLDHLRRVGDMKYATTDLVVRGRGGALIPVQLVTVLFPGLRGPPAYRSILTDITQRRAAEAALSQSQQDYHRLIDTIEGIVWEADAGTFQVAFMSHFAQRLLGFKMDDWAQAGFWQNRIYVEDRERVVNAIARAVSNRQPLKIDYRVVSADRRILWLHDNITTLERGGQLRLLGVAVDITEQHHTQEELRRAREQLEQRVNERTAELRASVQDLEAFSYSVSHDLRSPLRCMLGYAEIALNLGGDQLSAQTQDCLRRIIEGGVRADRLVQDVLAYSQVSRAKFQLVPVDLDKFMRELIAEFPDFRPPKARLQVQSPLLPVLAHEALLGQCTTNLLTNAVKFVSPGTVPQVKIWTERTDGTGGRDGKMPRRDAVDAVRIWIEDNGIGIAHENLGRIFNIFERVHPGHQFPGTGIGLAIVRKAVERMGGALGVQSESGKGSRFWVELKAA